jgi:hypothetical protein
MAGNKDRGGTEGGSISAETGTAGDESTASAMEPDRERPASDASAEASSVVSAKRRSGSFWRQREIRASRAAGTSGSSRPSGSGSRSITATSTWAGVSRRKAGRPVTIS